MGRVFIFKHEFSGYFMRIEEMVFVGFFFFENIYETLLCQISVERPTQGEKGG